MNTHQFYDRKQYVEQVRNSFSADEKGKKTSYAANQNEEEAEVHGFFKVRFLLALLLFLGFLFLQQSNFSYQSINAAYIAEQIEQSVSLPDFFPDLKDVIKIP